MSGARPVEIPAGLLYPGRPGIIEDPATATQADYDRAYADSFLAWEGCAANLEAIAKLTNGTSLVKKR